MNYQKIYDRLMSIARSRNKPEGYVEEHHEKPVCLYGENDSLVPLTAREHLFAHLLFMKLHKGNRDLEHAAFRMSNYWIYGTKQYGWAKERWANSIRGENNPAKREEVRKKISDNNPMKNEKYRAQHKIACNTEERKAAVSAQFSGQNNPSCRPEVKALRRENLKLRQANGEMLHVGDKSPLRNPEILARVIATRAKRRLEAKERGETYGEIPPDKHPMKRQENKQKASISASNQWKDPEMRAKMSAAISAGLLKKKEMNK